MKRISSTKIQVALAVVLFSFLGWIAWNRQITAPAKIVTFNGGIRDVAIGKDGSLLVCGEYSHGERDRTKIVFISPAREMLQPIVPKDWNGHVEHVNFSPDGRRALGTSQWGIWIGEIQDGKIAQHKTTAMQDLDEKKRRAARLGASHARPTFPAKRWHNYFHFEGRLRNGAAQSDALEWKQREVSQRKSDQLRQAR
jgi:glucose/arabinose dehydrogenase